MKDAIRILKDCTLFQEITESQIEQVLETIEAQINFYKKGQTILSSGTLIDQFGIVLEGTVYVETVDVDGNRTILYEMGKGTTFAETVSFSDINRSPVSFIAASPCRAIFFSIEKFLTAPNAFPYHFKLMKNIVKLLAEKNLGLHIKNDILSRRTTREKLLAFLNYQSKLHNSKAFYITMSRDELADYLAVNRAAMVREISKLRNEGILRCRTKYFVLNNKE